MGTVRLLLALSVVLAHTGYTTGWGLSGSTAVQAFFMISGFYIAMVLDGPYRGEPVRFWVNRALRLYPIYLTVLAITFGLKVASSGTYLASVRDLSAGAQALITLSNALLFGQDGVMFAGIRDGSLSFFSDYHNSTPQLWTLLLVPQAWSLGVELCFYALAPFLYRLSTRALAGVVISSLVLRGVLLAAGFDHDPWTYRFFPTELALFLAGGVAFRLTRLRRVVFSNRATRGATALVLAGIPAYGVLPGAAGVKTAVFLLIFVVCLPMVFQGSKASRIDRYVGDLSYPVYISHWLVLLIFARVVGSTTTVSGAVIACIATVAFSALLYAAIDTPVERLRSMIRNRQFSRAAAAARA